MGSKYFSEAGIYSTSKGVPLQIANGHSFSPAHCLDVAEILLDKDVSRESSIRESVFCGVRSRVLSCVFQVKNRHTLFTF